jgi:uncharacterized protein (DUF2249 family)
MMWRTPFSAKAARHRDHAGDGAQLARDHCFIGHHLRADVAYEVGQVELQPATQTDGELDVRSLPPAQRHQLIFSTLDKLEAGAALTLVNDHDPSPLRYQLDATRGDLFSWDYLESGPKTLSTPWSGCWGCSTSSLGYALRATHRPTLRLAWKAGFSARHDELASSR